MLSANRDIWAFKSWTQNYLTCDGSGPRAAARPKGADQDIAFADRIGGTDHPFAFHLFRQAGRPVIADLKLALDVRRRGLAIKGAIVTINAIGTQKDIACVIKRKIKKAALSNDFLAKLLH